MKLNIVEKREAPVPPYQCELFCFPVEAVPFLLQSIWLKSQKYWWLTPEDAKQGRRMLAQVGSELMMPCGTIIGEKLDALYRLMDTTLNGVQYTASGTGTAGNPFVITPAIPTVPNQNDYEYPGQRAMIENSLFYLRNLVDGSPAEGVTETDNFRQTLREIRDAILADTEGEIDYTPILLEVLAALL